MGPAATGKRGFLRLAPILLLAGLALIASLAFASAASASPHPQRKRKPISNVSYTSAHVTGHVSTPGVNNAFFQNEVKFQYSTDKVNWTTGPRVYFRLSAKKIPWKPTSPGSKAAPLTTTGSRYSPIRTKPSRLRPT